jgi:cytochrome c biogenesis factor
VTDFRFEIGNPWLLLALVPALVLGIIPFFRLHKKRRRASKHIVPFIIHMVLIFLLATTLSGMRIVETTTAPVDSSVVFVR